MPGVNRMSEKKKVLIIGAGPAGLTAAYELLSKSKEYSVTILEESRTVGGISRTVNYKGNRMDMGGHRFFSKMPEVNQWWEAMLPTQGVVPMDDKQLRRESTCAAGGPDPDQTDRVMLRRNRLSRIYFRQLFFDYPISLKWDTLRNIGFGTTLAVGLSYLHSVLFPREEKSLEDFYINRFGKKLYSMFFENYTENLWGRHPSCISPEWGAQRAKGLSVLAIAKDMFGKVFHRQDREVETSLIEEFSYPKLGPGQLWELTAQAVKEMGGEIRFGAKVTGLRKDDSNVLTALSYEQDGERFSLSGDIFLSSMPLRDLVAAMNDVPETYAEIAAGLPYRDYMTVGVLLRKLNLKNETGIPTLGNIVPDNWVYVHDRSVKMSRFQIYNNWSPYLVKDPEHTVWMGLEYFCSEGDELWSMSDESFARLGVQELITMGLIDSEEDVLDSHAERVKKAYPAYFDTYSRIDELRAFLDSIPNLFCIGRNGQHRYNNIDHSMCTAFEAVSDILTGREDKSNVWNVNTEQEYHEEGKKTV